MDDKELVDIYDTSRNKLGYTKDRKKDVLENGECIVGVQAAIINSKNELLISKRSSLKKAEPLKWECNGGALLANEEPINGIIREIDEELGIKLNKNDAIFLKTAFDGRRFKDIFLFKNDTKIEDVKFQDNEAIEAKWVSIDEYVLMQEKNEIVKSNDFEKDDFENCLKLLK